jgi:hypothetical protein
MSKFIFTAVLGMGISLSAVAQDGPAPIATLAEIEGKGNILVNFGDEFVPAKEGMRLKPGDRVMAQDDSSAEIKYDDECEYEVEENRIVTVPDRSNCAGGVPLVQELNPAGTGVVGAASGESHAGFWLGLVAAVDAWLFFESDDDTVSP